MSTPRHSPQPNPYRTSHRRRLAAAAGLAAIALTLAAPARAHHGRDFLLVQTAAIPHPGEGWAVARQDWIEEDEAGKLELEPSVLLGLTDWLAFEVHGHAGRPEGGSLEYESTAPAVHLRFARPHARWAVGLSGEYAFSHRDELPDAAAAALTLSGSVGRALVAVNLLAEETQEPGADVEWGYAAGLRLPITARLHWGLEVRGGFEDDDEPAHEEEHPGEEEAHHDALTVLVSPHAGEEHGAEEGHESHGLGDEALLGLYFEPGERLSVNLGVGTGIDGAPDVTLRTAVVWRFR